jgi:hypothetical protein
MHPSNLPIDMLLSDCQIRTGRRSGPGGQHRNKVETAVVVEHLPSGLSAEATERRSQSANRLVAIFRLRLRLAVELRSPWVAQSLVTVAQGLNADIQGLNADVHGLNAAPLSAIWKQRTAQGRLAVAAEHDDFPSILAEALDHLASMEWRVPEASERLGISSTQLVKLLKKHPPALQLLNQQRQMLGLVPLL